MNVFAVTIDSDSRTVPNKAIEWVLREEDWFRLMNGRMYFVATEKESDEIYQLLKNVLHEDDLYFIVKVVQGQNSIGFLQEPAWQWLQKYFPFTMDKGEVV
jgi:hypothetical protein